MSDVSLQVISMPEQPDSIVVRLNGPMDVSNVSSLLMNLLSAFERADSVTVDLSGITEMDAAGLQLFCSAHRSSIFSNKEFKITGQEKLESWNVGESIGCPLRPGCGLNTEHTCIWTGTQQPLVFPKPIHGAELYGNGKFRRSE